MTPQADPTHYLTDARWPASKADLLLTAATQDATEAALTALTALPARRYANLRAVADALAGHRRGDRDA